MSSSDLVDTMAELVALAFTGGCEIYDDSGFAATCQSVGYTAVNFDADENFLSACCPTDLLDVPALLALANDVETNAAECGCTLEGSDLAGAGVVVGTTLYCIAPSVFIC